MKPDPKVMIQFASKSNAFLKKMSTSVCLDGLLMMHFFFFLETFSYTYSVAIAIYRPAIFLFFASQEPFTKTLLSTCMHLNPAYFKLSIAVLTPTLQHAQTPTVQWVFRLFSSGLIFKSKQHLTS